MSFRLCLQSENNSVLLGYLSMPDATYLYHCLKNKQLKPNAFSGNDSAKGVFIIMHT